MRSLLVGVGMIVGALAVLIYGTGIAMLTLAVRDRLHSRLVVRRMCRSGEPKRSYARVDEHGVLTGIGSGPAYLWPTWVADDDGNVIGSDGNSWVLDR